jgi:hypothetical protein
LLVDARSADRFAVRRTQSWLEKWTSVW